MTRWTETPILVVPAALAIVALLVLGFEASPNVAAAFFGAFFAAIATVLAVLLSSHESRRNEKIKEVRQRRDELHAIGVELDIKLESRRNGLAPLEKRLRDYFRNYEMTKFSPASQPPPIPNDAFWPLIEPYSRPFPERIMSLIGHLPKEAGIALHEVVEVTEWLRISAQDEKTYPKGHDVLPQNAITLANLLKEVMDEATGAREALNKFEAALEQTTE